MSFLPTMVQGGGVPPVLLGCAAILILPWRGVGGGVLSRKLLKDPPWGGGGWGPGQPPPTPPPTHSRKFFSGKKRSLSKGPEIGGRF